jgi:hypothetical protein
LKSTDSSTKVIAATTYSQLQTRQHQINLKSTTANGCKSISSPSMAWISLSQMLLMFLIFRRLNTLVTFTETSRYHRRANFMSRFRRPITLFMGSTSAKLFSNITHMIPSVLHIQTGMELFACLILMHIAHL